MGRSPPIRSKRAHLKLATHPTFSDVGHEALSSAPKKGATLRVLARFPGSVALLLAVCVPFSYSCASEEAISEPVKASMTFCGSVQATNTQKVLGASKEPEAMRFAVQPDG